MFRLRQLFLLGALMAASCVVSTAFAEEYHIEVVSKGFQHDFWKQVKRGCDDAGKEFGATVNFVGPANESAISEQLDQLEKAIAKRPSALCIAALSPESTVQLIYKAADNNIPIITFDSDIGTVVGNEVEAFVATDNKDAGAEAANRMYEHMRDRINASARPIRIGVFSQDITSQSIGDKGQCSARFDNAESVYDRVSDGEDGGRGCPAQTGGRSGCSLRFLHSEKYG